MEGSPLHRAKRLGHVRWTTLLFADALGSVQYEFWRYDVTEFILSSFFFDFYRLKIMYSKVCASKMA